jgi:hypothetical protein
MFISRPGAGTIYMKKIPAKSRRRKIPGRVKGAGGGKKIKIICPYKNTGEKPDSDTNTDNEVADYVYRAENYKKLKIAAGRGHRSPLPFGPGLLLIRLLNGACDKYTPPERTDQEGTL